jgi:hypothetical protein
MRSISNRLEKILIDFSLVGNAPLLGHFLGALTIIRCMKKVKKIEMENVRKREKEIWVTLPFPGIQPFQK